MTEPTTLRAHVVVDGGTGFVLDAELAVPADGTTALLGPNAAGKSTLLAALAGLQPLGSGRIRMGEATWDDPGAGVFVPPEDRRVGVVFQDRRLFAHLSVLDNVAFAQRSRGAGREESRAGARAWLERLGLTALAERRPEALSGGQAQAVALCRALASDPALVLLDEPMSALDVASRHEMRRLLSDVLGELRVPRLLVTHDPLEAFLLADRIHLIEGGRITQVGTPDEIRLHPRTPYAADLVGTNLVRGHADGGSVDLGGHRLQVADDVAGAVLLTIHPRAISVHAEHPRGSPRNTWASTIERVEDLGGRVRLLVGAPLPLTVEVTRAAVASLGLSVGREVWLAVKATEIAVVVEG